MSEKKNFWNQVISAMNGAITFGKIKPQRVMSLQVLQFKHLMEDILCHLMKMVHELVTLY